MDNMKINNKAAKPKQAILMNLLSIMLILKVISKAPVSKMVYAPPGIKVDIIPRKTSVIKKWFRPIIPKGSAKSIRPRIARFFMISTFYLFLPAFHNLRKPFNKKNKNAPKVNTPNE